MSIFAFLFQDSFDRMISRSKNHKIQHSKYIFVGIKLFLLIGILLDGIYSKGFPIFGNIQYQNFGMPVLHPIVVFISFFVSAYTVQLFCFRNISFKNMLLSLLISFMPGILAFSRASLLLSAIVVLNIFVYNYFEKIRIKVIFYLIVLALAAMYIFGITGNIRLNNQNQVETENPLDSSLIYQIGSANNSIKSDSVISPYFWPYIYLTSPTANLELAIDNNVKLNSDNEPRLLEFLITQFTPDFFYTKFYANYKNNVQMIGYNARITGVLTASTAFYGSFIEMGWIGIFMMSIVLLIFPIMYLYLLDKIQPGYTIIGISVLNCLYVLAIFDNPWSFSALSVQLFLLIIMSLFSRVKVKF